VASKIVAGANVFNRRDRRQYFAANASPRHWLPPPSSPRPLFGLDCHSAVEANAVVGPQRGYSGFPPSLNCPSPGDCRSDQEEASRWLAN
jgi:hypothetical protein